MFGHLKPEQLMTLIEGGAPSPDEHRHLSECARCSDTLKSVEAAYVGLKSDEQSIVEPDWAEFRFAVRNEILSRTVQRQTALRRWTGWTWRPATAWGLSVLLAIGVTAGVFLSRSRPAPVPEAPTVEFVARDAADTLFIETQGIEREMEVWSDGNLFAEISTLESDEAESLRLLLESEPLWTTEEQ